MFLLCLMVFIDTPQEDLLQGDLPKKIESKKINNLVFKLYDKEGL